MRAISFEEHRDAKLRSRLRDQVALRAGMESPSSLSKRNGAIRILVQPGALPLGRKPFKGFQNK